ncbi:MAG: hypothetical protein KGR16_07925 [Verrucomicrobia bacterium]|nr:hypothetical protein [Verrucomicrobiota bacterium]
MTSKVERPITPVLDALEALIDDGRVSMGGKTYTRLDSEMPNGVYTRNDENVRHLAINAAAVARKLIFSLTQMEASAFRGTLEKAQKELTNKINDLNSSEMPLKEAIKDPTLLDECRQVASMVEHLSVVNALLENRTLQGPQTLRQHLWKEFVKRIPELPKLTRRSIMNGLQRVAFTAIVFGTGYCAGTGQIPFFNR